MAKLTKPPGFGLIPMVIAHPIVNLRNDPKIPAERRCIEYIRATPFEYLDRWILANTLFDDSVIPTQVIAWSDGKVSLAIRQPQYHGEPATDQDIDRYFENAGWTSIPDPSREHQLFYNFAFEVLAIDAVSRNCYYRENELLPFDVILSRPDQELEDYLNLYPK